MQAPAPGCRDRCSRISPLAGQTIGRLRLAHRSEVICEQIACPAVTDLSETLGFQDKVANAVLKWASHLRNLGLPVPLAFR